MNAFFFWLFSGGMILFALSVILNRNAVASALCFTFTIVFMAGLFVMLSAYFLAMVQILVTAGAVMVLFLFIIMLLDLTEMEHMPRQKIWMACSLVLGIGFLVIVGKMLMATPQGAVTMESRPDPSASMVVAKVQHGRVLSSPSIPRTQSDWDKMDDTHRIGRLLFSTDTSIDPQTNRVRTSYVAPFEITSLLILVATVGVIVLCKQEDRPRPTRREAIMREAPPVEPREKALKD